MPTDQERGEMAMRLVVGVMAVIAVAVWIVPMVFLTHQQVDHAADLTGASRAQDPASRSTAPTDPIGKATDISVQASLSTAISAAQTLYAESGTYETFEAEAASFDASINVAAGPARPGTISVRGVSASTIVLVAVDEGGSILCVAADASSVFYGRVDAQTPLQCTGGW
jgi:ribonuclease BN (tRNA processing enzyme)